jgi:hypothetical protein
MNRKFIYTIGILLALVAVLGVVAGCGLKKSEEQTADTNQEQTAEQTDATTTEGTTDTATTDTTAATDTGDEALITLAEKFAAEYGSYNSQGNYQNITSLYSYMSESLRQQMATFVAEQQAKGAPGGYFETVTTILMSKALENSGSAATVLVDTFRESSSSTAGRSGKYQNALVRFVMESNTWKVDKIEWQ